MNDHTDSGPGPVEARTIAEAMKALKLGRTKIWQMIRDGEIVTVRFGRAVRIPLSEFRRLLTPPSK